MMESAHKSQLPRGLTVKQSSEPSMFQKYVSQLKQMKEEQKKDEMTILSMYLELLKKTLKSTAFGSSYETTVAVFSGLSMVQYIYTSYLDDDQDSLRDYSKRIELAFVILFSFDWLLYLLISDSSFNYIFSFHSLVDIIVGISVFSTYNLTLVPYINLKNFYEAIKYILFLCKRVRILRALRLKYFVDQITDVVQRQIALMILVVGLMILFFSSVIQYLEVQNRESAFHTWMYFVWITLTTVGYGDITAKSTLGRIAVMIFIAIAIIIIPSLTNELIELLKLQTTYVRATYNPVSKYAQHILICGNLSTVRFPDLFAQIFHEDHNDQLNVTVVILSPEPPSHELKLFIKSGKYSIVYLQGTPFSDHDLSRAKAENATAIFLMSNKFSDQFDNEDSKIILLNIEIKQYISYYHEPYNLFCLQLHRRENRRHLYDDDFMEMLDNDLVICFNEMKLGVMAKSIHMPGISAFLLNLITSFSQEDLLHEYRHIGYKEDEAKMIVTEKTYSGKTVRILWKQEYLQGCDWEIYVSPLPSIFAGIKFSDLSYQLYEKFGIILFGLEITDRYHSDYSKVFLNPANYIIPNDFDQFYIEAFVIAKDESQADFSFLFGVKAKESERKPKNPGFYIPDGYTVSDKQVITRIREENDDVHHREPSDTESANSPKIPTTHITDFTTPKSPKGYRSRTERNKFQYLKQSSLLAKGYGGITYEETLSRLENQHLHSHYYTRRMPVDVDKVTIKHHLTDEIPSVNNHIIIIGKVNFNWYDLIKPLRARSLGPVQPIALVSPTPLSNDMWQRIGIFEEVYFIKGTPLEEINLVRAGIFRASKVIILADVSDYNHQAAEAIDADVIFAYHFVSRLNPNINIMVEVMNPKNIIYLDRHFNEKTMSENYLLSSIFANGLLFPTSLLDSVVSQSYYNPHIVKVFSKFLELPEDYNRIDRAIDASKLLLASTEYLSASAKISNIDLPDLLKEDSPLKTMQGSCFYSIKVNESMVRKPYIQVYQELSLKGIIPLAVLRGTQPHSIMDIGPLGNRLPYVYTNPHSESRLFLCDHLFVLSIEPLIEREASHVNENFTPNFGGPSYSPSPFDMKAPFNTYAPSVPTQNANDSPTERNNESSDSGQRILGFDNQTSVPVKTKTPVVDFHTAPLEPSFFNEKFNQVIQQINQQMHKKFENFIDEQDQRHQEILKRLDQVQQQQLQPQKQQQMRGPPKSNSADDSEKESDIKVVPIMLQQPRASSMATVRPSGFVNSEEDLLEKQKQYEMRAKPESKYFFQEPRRINTGGGSSVTSKKILAPKITSPILGPTIHDLNRTRSKYTRHPYLSQENSVAGQSFYDLNNQDDTSSLATYDDDNSIKSRGNGLVLSNADGSSPSLLNSLFIKK